MAHALATFAQFERRLIGQRTREALAVKRAQVIRLGRPPSITPGLARRIRSLRTRGHTLQAICDRLNGDGLPTGSECLGEVGETTSETHCGVDVGWLGLTWYVLACRRLCLPLRS